MAAHDTQHAAALGAGTWAASLPRAFHRSFPAWCIFWLGLTLSCGPSLQHLQHLQLSRCGLILTQGLNFATRTNGFKTNLGAGSPFPTMGHPEAMKTSRATGACSFSPGSQAASVHRWLEKVGYRQL